MPTLDRRLNAWRDDLADSRLEGQVDAERFVVGEAARLAVPVADLRPRPDLEAGIDSQVLFGADLAVFERRNGWAWVQAEADGYVGYLPETALMSQADAIAAPITHLVCAPRSFVYRGADLKTPATMALSMGSRVSVTQTSETRGTRYAHLAGGGAMVAAHLIPVGEAADDYVAIAARLLETPYLWGGVSAFGIDCSGLVQLSMAMAGRNCPRDSDMQEAAFARPVGREEAGRGDLVFWKGHVAIMENEKTVLHANGHTMSVARESLNDALRRIAPVYGQPTGWRGL